METVNYRQKQCEVEIIRVQRETDEEDSAEFFENITQLFSPKIQIEERYLNTENMEFSFLGENEDIPEATFEFEYCEMVPQEKAEILEEVIFKMEG